MHNSESAMHVMRYHHNPRYLSSVGFKPEAISVFTDIEACVAEADIVVLAVPSAFVKEVLADLDPALLRKRCGPLRSRGLFPMKT